MEHGPAFHSLDPKAIKLANEILQELGMPMMDNSDKGELE
jgi:hypothetical protein